MFIIFGKCVFSTISNQHILLPCSSLSCSHPTHASVTKAGTNGLSPRLWVMCDSHCTWWFVRAAQSHQLCPALCDSMDYSLPGSSVHGIFQARILKWAAMPSSRGIFLTQGSNKHLLHYRRALYHWATWEDQWFVGSTYIYKIVYKSLCLQKSI